MENENILTAIRLLSDKVDKLQTAIETLSKDQVVSTELLKDILEVIGWINERTKGNIKD